MPEAVKIYKSLAVMKIPIESIPQVYGFLDPSAAVISDYGIGWANAIIVSQLFIGSYLVFLLDELVSKWGIGSGISLFIAAGVASPPSSGPCPRCLPCRAHPCRSTTRLQEPCR